MIKNKRWMSGCLLGFAFLTGCQSTFDGSYVEKTEMVDDKWNQEDAVTTVEAMAEDCLSKAWLNTWKSENSNKTPRLLLGDFANNTTEHIDTNRLFERLRHYLINSGKVRFIDGDARKKILGEMQYQNAGLHANPIPVGAKSVADLFMFGVLSEQKNGDGGKTFISYQITMRLTDIKTEEIVWSGMNDINKRVSRSRYGK